MKFLPRSGLPVFSISLVKPPNSCSCFCKYIYFLLEQVLGKGSGSVCTSQSNELVQHSFLGWGHIGERALHVLNLIWFGRYISRLSQWGGGGGGVIYSFNSNDFFLSSQRVPLVEGGRSVPCGVPVLLWRRWKLCEILFVVCISIFVMTFRVDAEALTMILILKWDLWWAGLAGTPPAWRVRGACSASSRIRCPLPQRRRRCRRSAHVCSSSYWCLSVGHFLIWILHWSSFDPLRLIRDPKGAKWQPEIWKIIEFSNWKWLRLRRIGGLKQKQKNLHLKVLPVGLEKSWIQLVSA